MMSSVYNELSKMSRAFEAEDVSRLEAMKQHAMQGVGSYPGGPVTDFGGTRKKHHPLEALKDTAFNEAEATFRDMVMMVDRVERIVDRLLGSQPEKGGEAGDSSEPNGLIEELRMNAYRARSHIQRAHSALDRLDKAL